MKKLNLLALVFALLMGVSFTSCLGSGESEGPYDWVSMVYVVHNIYGGDYFKDVYGNIYNPTLESINAIKQNNTGFDLANYDMAIIYFNWVADETTAQTKEGTTTPQEKDIELVGIQKIDVPGVVVASNKEQMDMMAPSTAPVLSLRQTSTYINLEPQMLDTKTLIVYTGFYTANDKDEFAKHSIKMGYAMDEVKESSDELIVYIHHDKGTDDKTDTYYANYYAFNLESAIQNFRSEHNGAAPKRIVVKAKEAIGQSTSLPDNYTEYDVEYKETLDNN